MVAEEYLEQAELVLKELELVGWTPEMLAFTLRSGVCLYRAHGSSGTVWTVSNDSEGVAVEGSTPKEAVAEWLRTLEILEESRIVVKELMLGGALSENRTPYKLILGAHEVWLKSIECHGEPHRGYKDGVRWYVICYAPAWSTANCPSPEGAIFEALSMLDERKEKSIRRGSEDTPQGDEADRGVE